MAIAAIFYRWAKETNSTLRPDAVTGDDKVTRNITLKAACSILNPTIVLKYDENSTNPTGYNYCYIADFKRYYWITNWAWANRAWVATLAVDVLATYKAEIGASEQYVLRASNAYDGSITDSTYPIKNNLSVDNMDVSWSWSSYANGMFFVGIINKDASGIGGTVNYYAMTRAGLGSFAATLMTDPNTWLQIPATEISNELAKALVNPLDYVVSVKWVPLAYNDIKSNLTAVTTITFGYYSFGGVSGVYRINTIAIEKTLSNVTIKKHPQAAARGDFLNSDPYTSYILHFPPFGDIPLDTSIMVGATSLSFRVDMDIATTSAVLTVYSNKAALQSSEILKARTTIGVDVRMDKIGYDVTNNNFGYYMLASAGLSALQGIRSGTIQRPQITLPDNFDPIQAMRDEISGIPAIKMSPSEQVQNAAYNIGSAIVQHIPPDIINGAQGIVSAFGTSLVTCHSAGAVGSWAEYFRPSVYVQCVFAQIANEAQTQTGEEVLQLRGRPLCQMRVLSQLGGYMIISDPHLENLRSATSTEIDMVRAALSAGFWMV